MLFALLLPLFLGMGALAVDVGYWYVVQKTAQDAADAAALAAARELPDCGAAEDVARVYGTRNMPEATVVPSCGLSGAGSGAGTVEVTVSTTADTFFGKVFGILSATITQHAIAERLNDPGNLAIFSYEHDCDDGLEFGAEQVSINGFVHSNGQFRISKGPFWAADGTVSRNNCPSSVEPDIYSQFGDAPPLNRLPRDVFDTLTWPAWFTPADFGWLSGCTYTGRTITITSQRVVISQPRRVIRHSGVIPSGTYCATQSVTLTGDGLSGAITALAPSITVDAPHSTFRPYSGTGVLFFAVPNTDLDPGNDGSLAAGGDPNCQPASAADMSLTGEDVRWRGVIFSPCGRVVANVGGSTVALDGVLIARKVRVTARGFSIVGRSDFEVSTALVE